jgi:hypothetical protein
MIWKRKNNNPSYDYNLCEEVDSGVDLNRNYDYHFGDGTGSSDYPCS